jgi:hypothetical protein
VLVAMKGCSRHIGIVISRHHAHIGRPPQCFKPPARMGELGREGDIDEIACDGDMVRLPAVKVMGNGIERIAAMAATAAAPPVDVADETLRREFPHGRLRHRAKMRVRQMCEHEWFAHGAFVYVSRDHHARPPDYLS